MQREEQGLIGGGAHVKHVADGCAAGSRWGRVDVSRGPCGLCQCVMAGACLDQAQPCWRSLCPCLCRPPCPNTLTIRVAPRFAPQLPRPASSHSLLFTTPTPPVVQCGAACSSAVVPACGPRYLLLSTESGAVCATCGQQHRVVSGGVAVRLPLAAVPQEACKRSTRSPGATAPDVRAMCVTKGGGEPRPGSALHASCKDTHVEDRHVEAEVPLHPRAVPAPVGVGGVGGVGWGGGGARAHA